MSELSDLRKMIDLIDYDIIRLLEERSRLSGQVIEYKTKNNLPVSDNDREKFIIERLSVGSKLEREFIEALYSMIFRYSKKDFL